MFELGSVYPAALNVFDANANPTNAGSVSLTITLPDGVTQVTPSVANPPAATGQYTYSYITTQPGRHTINWLTASPTTAYADVFDVAESSPSSILSLADAKSVIQIDPADTSNDDLIRFMMRGLTKAVEEYLHEEIVQKTIVENHQFELFTWNWTQPRLRLYRVPVITLQSLVSWDGQVTWTPSTNMYVDTDTGLVTVMTGPQIYGAVVATYICGYQIIPYNYLEGSKVLFQHIWESRRGPGGIDGVVGPEEMQDYRHYSDFPRKVKEWLGPPRPVVF